jgi:hypothetical protein
LCPIHMYHLFLIHYTFFQTMPNFSYIITYF